MIALEVELWYATSLVKSRNFCFKASVVAHQMFRIFVSNRVCIVTLVKNVGCAVLIQYQENVGPSVGEEMWQFGDVGVVTMESARLCCNGGCVMSTCRCFACVMHSSESMQNCTFTRLISDIGPYIRHLVAPAEASAEQESTLIQTLNSDI